MNELHYREVAAASLSGHGVKILVAMDRAFADGEVRDINMVAEKLVQELKATTISMDPIAQEEAAGQKKFLIGLFDAPIYVRDIPNGYCPNYCCRHLPWFLVTTKVGTFRIGMRKRVISIDWSETTVDESATALFVDESVTRYERVIHAWSGDDAKRYIAKVVAKGGQP